MSQYWETNLFQEVDYYKKILLDGCLVKKKDVEMCDLRFFFRRRYEPNPDRPRIQIYKKNRGGKEIIEQYSNYDDAYVRFATLVQGK